MVPGQIIGKQQDEGYFNQFRGLQIRYSQVDPGSGSEVLHPQAGDIHRQQEQDGSHVQKFFILLKYPVIDKKDDKDSNKTQDVGSGLHFQIPVKNKFPVVCRASDHQDADCGKDQRKDE